MGKGFSKAAGSKRMLAREISQSRVPALPGVAVVVTQTRQQKRSAAAQAAEGVFRVHPDQAAYADGDLDGVTLVRVVQKNAPAKVAASRGRGMPKGVASADDDTSGSQS